MSQDAHIFLCTDATEEECLQLQLFGGGRGFSSKAGKVSIGDPLFLYNFDSQRLHGVFKATSESAMNIVPDAWKGSYPWQVRVMRTEVCAPLSRTDMEGFIDFVGGFPKARLSADMLEELLARFQSVDRLSPIEKDYRDENPANIRTEDGHKVRSEAERVIDDWLFKQRIAHGYESKVLVGKEKLSCDFFIPTIQEGQYIYIEYWGLNTKSYLDRKAQKLKIYKQGSYPLIELSQKDLRALDKKLRTELLKLGIIK